MPPVYRPHTAVGRAANIALWVGLGSGLHATSAHAQALTVSLNDYIEADRPGLADSSSVVGQGRFQVEAGVQQEFRRDADEHSRTIFAPVLLRLGVSDKLEVRLESNTYSWRRTSDLDRGGQTTDGVGPTSVGVKYQLLDGGQVGEPGLAAILRVYPPSGSGGFRNIHATGDLRLAADLDLSPQWSLNPNVGIAVYEDEATRKLYSAGHFAMTVSYKPRPTWTLFADTGIQYPDSKRGQTSVLVDVGTAINVARSTQLDVSVGWGLAGQTTPKLFLAAGVSQRF